MTDWSYGRRNIRILDMLLVLTIHSFWIYHAEIAVCNVIFSFLPGMANGLLFPFLHICFIANLGSEWLILISYFDCKVIVKCLLCKVSDFYLTVRKNHIITDIIEPVRIILTLVIHSYRNTDVKLKREKKSAFSSSLTLDTVQQAEG